MNFVKLEFSSGSTYSYIDASSIEMMLLGLFFSSDVFPDEDNPTKLKISHQQFINIIDEWYEKVCKNRPKEVIIKHFNDQFTIETKA